MGRINNLLVFSNLKVQYICSIGVISGSDLSSGSTEDVFCFGILNKPKPTIPTTVTAVKTPVINLIVESSIVSSSLIFLNTK